MPRNFHESAFSAALGEVENMKEAGVTDCDTLVNGGILAYGAYILSQVETTQTNLRLQAMNAQRLMGFSMIVNFLLLGIILLGSIAFFWSAR